jgi:hypothetical protein
MLLGLSPTLYILPPIRFNGLIIGSNNPQNFLVKNDKVMAEHIKTESFSTDSNLLETVAPTPSPLLPRSAWKSQLARTRALLKAKQALDREELQFDFSRTSKKSSNS